MDGGHAWNLVRLDGKAYWTDLTWDANRIKVDRYPLSYCLKSTEDFNHNIYMTRYTLNHENPCKESLSSKDQILLFTGKNIENRDKAKEKEDENIGYISSCVISIAEGGIVTSTDIRKTKGLIENSMNYDVTYGNQEVTDGRDKND